MTRTVVPTSHPREQEHRRSIATLLNQVAQQTPDHSVTAAETAASVTPVDFSYPEGHVLRYGQNTTPGTTDMTTAINNAFKVGGEIAFPDESLAVSSGLVIPANVNADIRMGPNTNVFPTVAVDALIALKKNSYVRIRGGTLSDNGNISAVDGAIIDGNKSNLGPDGTENDIPLTLIIEGTRFDGAASRHIWLLTDKGGTSGRRLKLEDIQMDGASVIGCHVWGRQLIQTCEIIRPYSTNCIRAGQINQCIQTTLIGGQNIGIAGSDAGWTLRGQGNLTPELEPSESYGITVVDHFSDMSASADANASCLNVGIASGYVTIKGCVAAGNSTILYNIGIDAIWDDLTTHFASRATITGCTMKGSGNMNCFINGVNFCNITGNNFADANNSGIQIRKSKKVLVDSNTFDIGTHKPLSLRDVDSDPASDVIWGRGNVVFDYVAVDPTVSDVEDTRRPVLIHEYSGSRTQHGMLSDLNSYDTSTSNKEHVLARSWEVGAAQDEKIVPKVATNDVQIKTQNETFTDADVTTASDQITVTAHPFETGDPVQAWNVGGALPTGLSQGVVYYVISVDANTIQLAASASDADAGTAVDITAASGTGTHHVGDALYDASGTLVTTQITLDAIGKCAHMMSIEGGWLRL